MRVSSVAWATFWVIVLILVSQGNPRAYSQSAGARIEQLVNGGFESGLEGWYLPPWYGNVARADGSLVHSGASALRFEGRSAGPYVRQDVPAFPGQTVQLTGWASVPRRAGTMEMIVELVARHQNNGDLRAFTVATIASVTKGWIPLEGQATMPDRTSAVRVQIRFPGLDGTACIDDLSLLIGPADSSPTAAPSPVRATATQVASPSAPTAPAITSTIAPASSPTASPAALLSPTATLLPTPSSTPPTVVQPPFSGPLAGAAWPTYGQNQLRNSRSPFAGPQSMPTRKWAFARTDDHWGTDYRGFGIGEKSTVYLAAGMAGVYALNPYGGQVRWLFSPDSTGHETWVEFPPTVASDGTLYIASENDFVYALSPEGKTLWSFRSDHLHTPISISPDGSTVHFVSEEGYLCALDRRTGALRWRYQLGPYRVYGTGRRVPVVYDPSGNLYFGWLATVWSLTPAGQKRWSLDVPTRGSYLVGPAVSDDGTLYFTMGDSMLAVSMSGQLRWQYLLSKSAFDRTPTIGADGTVYIGAEDGAVYALSSSGTLRWRQQYVTQTGWGGGVKSNILLDRLGTLYFLGRDRYIYAVSSASGQLLWRYATGYDDSSYPGIQLALDANGVLYVPVDEGVAYALMPADGAGASPTPTVTPTASPQPTSTPTRSSTARPLPSSTEQPTATPLPLPAKSILYGAWVGSSVNVAGDQAAFEQAIGKPRAIIHWYWSVSPISCDAARFAEWASTTPQGAILMLSWAPSPTDSSLDAVNAGVHDGYILGWARAIKAYGREVWLRTMWEDNGTWFWWSSGRDSDITRKEKYRSAFQRVVDLFRGEGTSNVKFVWSPVVSANGGSKASLSYPGDRYVDWIALDGYPLRGGMGDFYSTFKPDYDALSSLGKTMMIGETGINLSADPERASYVTNLLGYELPIRFPNFSAFVWFNEPGWGDLLDPSYPATLAAFRAGIAGPYYRGR